MPADPCSVYIRCCQEMEWLFLNQFNYSQIEQGDYDNKAWNPNRSWTRK